MYNKHIEFETKQIILVVVGNKLYSRERDDNDNFLSTFSDSDDNIYSEDEVLKIISKAHRGYSGELLINQIRIDCTDELCVDDRLL